MVTRVPHSPHGDRSARCRPGCALGAAGLAAIALATVATTPLAAGHALGVHGGWAVFADAGGTRCYAIAEPVRGGRDAGWRPFAAIASWPARGIRGQLNVRLRKPKLHGAPVFLTIGRLRVGLLAGGADAWASTPAIDARIVAAMRGGDRMTVSTRSRDGQSMVDSYALPGAATAIDAAAIACARR